MDITTNGFWDEDKMERKFREWRIFIPLVTLVTSALLVCGITYCMHLFREGCHFVVFPSALFYHAAMIVVVHDGAHKAITRTPADSWIITIFGGLVLLPFYPEPFRRYHLIHHAHTNEEVDPLWPEQKKVIFEKNRWLYVLAEFIPFGFLLLSVNNHRKRSAPVPGPRIRWEMMLISFAISALVIFFVKPDPLFIIFSVLIASVLARFRHWCEHIGDNIHRESNTYWFPLGMGIGNHVVHHAHTQYSWFTLMLGLFGKKRDTNPLKAFVRLLTDKNYRHYPAAGQPGKSKG